MSDVSIETPGTGQKIAAEVLGTFVLVFVGCGAVVMSRAAQSDADLVGLASIGSVGLAFGLAVLIMAYAVGRISGGHFNPAVTLGAAIGGRLPWRDLPLYMAAQFVGATVAALALFAIGSSFEGWEAEAATMGANGFGDGGISWWGALILETLLTAIFLWVILGVTDARNEHPGLAPLAIGLALAAIHFVAIPATGTSVNPARSFGPALFSGSDAIIQLWLFFLAPLLGAAIAGATYRPLFGGDAPVPGSGLARRRAVAVGADAYQQQWNQQEFPGQQGQLGQSGQYAQPGQPGQYAQPGQPGYAAQPAQPGWPQPGQPHPGQPPVDPQQSWPQQPPQEQRWQQPQEPGQWSAPQQGQQSWGEPPEGDDDGRTQIRPS
jgi:aquaporin Z